MASKHHETFQNNGILSYSGRLLHHNNNSCRKSWTRSERSQHAGSQPRENEPVRSTVRSHGPQAAASCRLSDEASFTATACDQSNTNLCTKAVHVFVPKQSTFLYQSSPSFCTKTVHIFVLNNPHSSTKRVHMLYHSCQNCAKTVHIFVPK
jgi:hypothetical protein